MTRRDNNQFHFCIFPGYNWCGPGTGCSGPGAPINDVDAACKAHDICYQRGGNRCACDQEFLSRLRPYISSSSQQGRHARLLYHYMKIQTVFSCNRW